MDHDQCIEFIEITLKKKINIIELKKRMRVKK